MAFVQPTECVNVTTDFTKTILVLNVYRLVTNAPTEFALDRISANVLLDMNGVLKKRAACPNVLRDV